MCLTACARVGERQLDLAAGAVLDGPRARMLRRLPLLPHQEEALRATLERARAPDAPPPPRPTATPPHRARRPPARPRRRH